MTTTTATAAANKTKQSDTNAKCIPMHLYSKISLIQDSEAFTPLSEKNGYNKKANYEIH